MIKLIASDMDGTLLNDFWRISEENVKAIKQAEAKGIKFIVATGRPYENAHILTEQVGINCPVIGLNGATTHNERGELIASATLSKDDVKSVIAVLQRNQIYLELMTNKGAFSVDEQTLHHIIVSHADVELAHLSEDERIRRVEMLHQERIKNERCQFIESFDEVLNDESIHIYKIFSMSLSQTALDRAAEELKNNENFFITSSGHKNLEVTASHGHKGYAVFNYAATLGIKPEEVMTMGDNFNDLTMLLGAGRGVAMENAHDDIKQQVKYTTKHHLEHGVAYAILAMLQEHN